MIRNTRNGLSLTAAPETAAVSQPVRLADRLTWGLDDITALTGLSRRTLERERSAGNFPPPDIRVGRRVLWRPETIHRWIDARARK
jgi:predicted DNA-binding transcriptional regulator AlpA